MARILIVDDDQMFRTLFCETLGLMGIETSVAISGDEALEKLQSASSEELNMLDAIMLDIQMPGLSGLELIDYLRNEQRFQQLKIIVITGDRMIESAPQIKLADLFLLKPIRIENLLKQIQTLLRM